MTRRLPIDPQVRGHWATSGSLDAFRRGSLHQRLEQPHIPAVLGMPLHADHELIANRFADLDGAVLGAASDRKPARIADRLMVRRVDRHLGAEQAVRDRIGREHRPVLGEGTDLLPVRQIRDIENILIGLTVEAKEEPTAAISYGLSLAKQASAQCALVCLAC